MGEKGITDFIRRYIQLKKAQFPEKLVLDTAKETVGAFEHAWVKREDLPLAQDVETAIASHIDSQNLFY